MNWYLKVLKQYADFDGRARRTEYWMYTLVNILVIVVLALLDNLTGMSYMEGMPYGYLTLLYTLAVFIPGLAVAIRRLHDMGKSGWWYLIGLVPFIGGIWLVILLATDGQPQENEYGSNPKA
tara:strand:- start:1099 stop:1464 length:366 start_codon:yes stop_codon:yes gene_type:complete